MSDTTRTGFLATIVAETRPWALSAPSRFEYGAEADTIGERVERGPSPSVRPAALRGSTPPVGGGPGASTREPSAAGASVAAEGVAPGVPDEVDETAFSEPAGLEGAEPGPREGAGSPQSQEEHGSPADGLSWSLPDEALESRRGADGASIAPVARAVGAAEGGSDPRSEPLLRARASAGPGVQAIGGNALVSPPSDSAAEPAGEVRHGTGGETAPHEARHGTGGETAPHEARHGNDDETAPHEARPGNGGEASPLEARPATGGQTSPVARAASVSPAGGQSEGAEPAAEARPGGRATSAFLAAVPLRPPQVAPSPAAALPMPRVHIGELDVIVMAPPEPQSAPAPPAPAPDLGGAASRRYLRGL